MSRWGACMICPELHSEVYHVLYIGGFIRYVVDSMHEIILETLMISFNKSTILGWAVW